MILVISSWSMKLKAATSFLRRKNISFLNNFPLWFVVSTYEKRMRIDFYIRESCQIKFSPNLPYSFKVYVQIEHSLSIPKHGTFLQSLDYHKCILTGLSHRPGKSAFSL